MSKKKDPVAPENAVTPWHKVSTDELQARMQRQYELDSPARKAAEIIDETLSGLLMFLGVDVDQPREIQELQQNDMGIVIYPNEDERTPQLNGLYIHTGFDDFTPFAWIGTVWIDQNGLGWVPVELFPEGKRFNVGGIKIIGG
jgi:hypothetical protein